MQPKVKKKVGRRIKKSGRFPWDFHYSGSDPSYLISLKSWNWQLVLCCQYIWPTQVGKLTTPSLCFLWIEDVGLVIDQAYNMWSPGVLMWALRGRIISLIIIIVMVTRKMSCHNSLDSSEFPATSFWSHQVLFLKKVYVTHISRAQVGKQSTKVDK